MTCKYDPSELLNFFFQKLHGAPSKSSRTQETEKPLKLNVSGVKPPDPMLWFQNPPFLYGRLKVGKNSYTSKNATYTNAPF